MFLRSLSCIKLNDRYLSDLEFYSDAGLTRPYTTFYAGSPGSISYRLNVNYKARDDNKVSTLSAYVNSQPFDLSSVDDWENRKYTSINSDRIQYGHAFEVVTDAFVEGPENCISITHESADPTDDEMVQKVELLPFIHICRARLFIRSLLLRKALGHIIRYYPDNTWISDPSVAATVFEPYNVLLHNYKEIAEFISRESNNTLGPSVNDTTQADQENTLRDMTLLLEFLKPLYESIVQPGAELLARNVPIIGFDMLWYLFCPGTDVWIQDSTDVYMAVVHKFEYKRHHHHQRKWDSTEPFECILHLWRLATDGNRVARTNFTRRFERYTGQVEVISLSVCPVSFWDATDQGSRRQNTLAKNNLLVEAIREGSLHVHYDGPNDTDVS